MSPMSVSSGPSEEAVVSGTSFENAAALEQLEKMAIGQGYFGKDAGYKFEPPKSSSQPSHLRERYDPVVHQVTNAIMRDGKLSKAQRVVQ